MATEIELIDYTIGDTYLSITFYKNEKTELVSVPINNFEKWAQENNRLKVLVPFYEQGNITDHDEMPIGFDTYLSILDKEEITEFLKSQKL